MSRRTTYLLGIGVIAALVVGWQVVAFGLTGSNFESKDANLDVDTTGNFDWNSFDPTNWDDSTFAAPYRQATESDAGGWDFFGMEDAQAVTSDSAFAGGVKQNDDCAKLDPQKADNKADLRRIYMSSQTIANGHVILNLAWVRIPQNTTSPSAHVAFEFNQNKTACTTAGNHSTPTGSLVPRSTANGGDLLILYDFEGGNDTPVISISRWTASGWSTPQPLNATQAEAAVNVSSPVSDDLAPPDGTNDQQLGIKEFGEAGIDLTAAGVFPATPTSCLSFGRTFGVSRTSGNSNTAQMKDIVGPGDINLTNCGTVITRKVTDPAGDTTTDFGFTTDVATLPASTTSPFSLKDGEANTISNVKPGSYNTTEDDPTADGYALQDIDCSASNTATAPTEDEATRKASFTIGAGETVDCTFTNKKQEGALLIQKQSTKTGNPLVSQAGAVFSYDPDPTDQTAAESVTDDGTGDEHPNAPGDVCVSGLAPGDYTVNETDPPPGYGDAPATEADQVVTVVAGTDCDDPASGGNPPDAGATATFTNPPLADIQVNFRDGGSDETSATITCDDSTGSADNTAASGWDTSHTVTGVEAPVDIHCTISIDP